MENKSFIDTKGINSSLARGQCVTRYQVGEREQMTLELIPCRAKIWRSKPELCSQWQLKAKLCSSTLVWSSPAATPVVVGKKMCQKTVTTTDRESSLPFVSVEVSVGRPPHAICDPHASLDHWSCPLTRTNGHGRKQTVVNYWNLS